MKKIIFSIIALFVFMSFVDVNAETVITEAKYENNVITVSGNSDSSVQIALFDMNGNVLCLVTATSSNGKFSKNLPNISNLSDGKYLIKVANYDGSNTSAKNIVVKNNKIVNTSNPNTGDAIIKNVVVGLLSLTAFISIVIYIKKKKVFN